MDTEKNKLAQGKNIVREIYLMAEEIDKNINHPEVLKKMHALEKVRAGFIESTADWWTFFHYRVFDLFPERAPKKNKESENKFFMSEPRCHKDNIEIREVITRVIKKYQYLKNN